MDYVFYVIYLFDSNVLKEIMTLNLPEPSLIVRCVTPFPQFFTDIPGAVNTAREKLQAESASIDIESLANGFLLHADTFSLLRDACARFFGVDMSASTGVREYGLWDIEVIKNAQNVDLSLLIRSLYLLCEKVVSRKKPEACKSISD